MEQLKCTEEGCDKLAEFTYVWPWGEEAACCGEHRVVVGQRATALGRDCPQFTAVAALQRPPTLTRDERVNFRAQILTLEEEVKDQRGYAGELYASNAGLTAEVQRLTQRGVHLEATVNALSQERDNAVSERDEARRVAAEVSQELARVKLLVPPPEPTTRPDGHVVEGER
jgi:hypothetical protein